MSLSNCLKKFGKAINKSDTEMLSNKKDEYVAKGATEKEAELLALRDVEESAKLELNEIESQLGLKSEIQDSGIEIEIDGQLYDSNRFMAEVDSELTGIDDIARCLYR